MLNYNCRVAMIYQMIDNSDLDPVGDGFYLHDAIMFVENNVYNYSEIP